jgi:hypothetical protein
MDSIWMGIAPGSMATRVMAMHGPCDTILKARLAREPSHPRAVATLLEAIALWQGAPVRAALAVDDRAGSCGSSLFHGAFPDVGTSLLYTVDWVPAVGRPRRRRPDITGMGDFADLRQLLAVEVAR